MVAKSYSRGWPIYYNGKEWFWEDTKQPVDDLRPCKRCKKLPTKEGHDACLGYIKGAKSACCGHGVEKPYIRKND